MRASPPTMGEGRECDRRPLGRSLCSTCAGRPGPARMTFPGVDQTLPPDAEALLGTLDNSLWQPSAHRLFQGHLRCKSAHLESGRDTTQELDQRVVKGTASAL